MVNTDITTPEGWAAMKALGDPGELLKLWKEENNLVAGLFLGHKYHFGDEEIGIFRDPEKAREIYLMVGEPVEESPFFGEDYIDSGTYTIKGDAEDIENLKSLLDGLTEKYGMKDNEFGLYIPVGKLMKALVNSPYYNGNVIFVELVGENALKIYCELDKPEVLLYALRKAYPNVEVDMKEGE